MLEERFPKHQRMIPMVPVECDRQHHRRHDQRHPNDLKPPPLEQFENHQATLSIVPAHGRIEQLGGLENGKGQSDQKATRTDQTDRMREMADSQITQRVHEEPRPFDPTAKLRDETHRQRDEKQRSPDEQVQLRQKGDDFFQPTRHTNDSM